MNESTFSESSCLLDKYDMIKNRRRRCNVPTPQSKVIEIKTDDSEDDGLVTDDDSSTERNQRSKIQQKKKQVNRTRYKKVSDSESSDSDEKGKSRNIKAGKGHPKKSVVKSKNCIRKPLKMCTNKFGYSKVLTLEDSDEEVDSKPKSPKSAKNRSKKREILVHPSGSKPQNMCMLKKSDINGNSKRESLDDSDDEIVLGKKLSTRAILNSDLDDTIQNVGEIQPESPNHTNNESNHKEERSQLKCRFGDSRNSKVKFDVKKEPILYSTRDDSLKAELKGDFKLETESESEEDVQPNSYISKPEIMAQLKVNLPLLSASENEAEVYSRTNDKNDVKMKRGDSGSSDSDRLVVDLAKRGKRRRKNPQPKQALTKANNVLTSSQVVTVKVNIQNAKRKESRENSLKSLKPFSKKTKKTFLDDVNPVPKTNLENDAKIKTSSESFVRAKYLVRQKRGFSREPLLEIGSFEDLFRKQIMRADILKLSVSLDDGLTNAIQMTDNMFEDSIETEDVVVSIDPEDLKDVVKKETPSDIKTELNSPLSSGSEIHEKSDSLEEKMLHYLKTLKPSPNINNVDVNRNILEDDLLERKMTKLVYLLNSVASDKCIERGWEKAVSKTFQQSMPSVQLEETTRKFAEVQRKLNWEHWLRTAGKSKEANMVNNVLKKEPPKPQVSFKPLKPTKFKIPRKTQKKKIWTKIGERWRQALDVDNNGCYKVNDDGRRVLCKSHHRDVLDYAEFDFKEDTVIKSEIKEEIHHELNKNRKAKCSTPDQPLFTSSPKRLLSEDGPLLTSSPRHISSQPATPDFLLDVSDSSDTLAGNLPQLGQPVKSSDEGKKEIAEDVMNYSMETHVPSPRNLYANFVFEDLLKEDRIEESMERIADLEGVKGNGEDNLVVKENSNNKCEDDHSSKSIFSSMLKLRLNVPKL